MKRLARSPGLEMQTRVFGDLDRRDERNDTSLGDLKCMMGFSFFNFMM